MPASKDCAQPVSNLKQDRRFESLPLGAPARRVRIDLGPSPIRSSAPPCRILGAEPKRSRGYLVDDEYPLGGG